jgi:hypothetical protein
MHINIEDVAAGESVTVLVLSRCVMLIPPCNEV